MHLIAYHAVWCPKRRKPILTDAVAQDCYMFIAEKCIQRVWEILELVIRPDHVHLFVRAWPTDSAAYIVKECKGATSFRLRDKYPQLKRLPSLWTRSFFVSTAGNISSEIIQKYIEAQKGI